MPIKSKVRVKKVNTKAWVVVSTYPGGYGDFALVDMYNFKTAAESRLKQCSSDCVVVPCVISFTLPSKKR